MAKTKGQGNPDWTRDEVVLALDIYLSCAGKIPGKSHPLVIELSELLQHNPEHMNVARNSKFRNPDGVAFKLQNIRAVATGVGLKNTAEIDRLIWEQFGDKPNEVRALAEQIRAAIASTSKLKRSDQEELTFPEGRIITRTHIAYERSVSLRRELLQSRREADELKCDCCGYRPPLDHCGDWALAALEVHHVTPISRAGQKRTRLNEVALLCANCHRLMHRVISLDGVWPSANELRRRLGFKT